MAPRKGQAYVKTLPRGKLCSTVISMLERLPYLVAILTAEDHRCIFANRAAQDALARIGSPTDIIGEAFWTIFPAWKKGLLPYFDKVLTTDEAIIVRNCAYVYRAITTYWDIVLLRNVDATSGKPISITLTATDVTEREYTRARVDRNRKRLERLMWTTPHGIVMVDHRGRVRLSNAMARSILGLLAREVQRWVDGDPELDIATVWGTPIPNEARAYQTTLTTGQLVYGFEEAVKRPDGTVVMISVNSAPTPGPVSDQMGVVLTLADITERRETERHERELESRQHDFYRRTILAATRGKLEIVDTPDIERMVDSPCGIWNIEYPVDVTTVRHVTSEIAREAGMDKNSVYELEVCVGEITTNICKHAGSGCAYLCRGQDRLLFIAVDHGPGIEAVSLPDVALTPGFSTVGTLGMGYKAVIAYADKVYLSTSPEGTAVAVEKRIANPDRGDPECSRIERLSKVFGPEPIEW